jgi:hypothetical protein
MAVAIEQQDGAWAHSAIKVGDRASCQRHVGDEGRKGEEMPMQAARNDGSGCAQTAFCLKTPHPAPATAPWPPKPAENTYHAQAPDPDPSRMPPAHGNDGFSQRAWRDQLGMPDSGGALPFACLAGRLGHSVPCNKSDFGRTADRPEPDCGTRRK